MTRFAHRPAAIALAEVQADLQTIIDATVEQAEARFNKMTREALFEEVSKHYDGVKKSETKKRLVDDLVWVETNGMPAMKTRDALLDAARKEARVEEYFQMAERELAGAQERLQAVVAEPDYSTAENACRAAENLREAQTMVYLYGKVAYVAESRAMGPLDALQVVVDEVLREALHASARGPQMSSSRVSNFMDAVKNETNAQWLLVARALLGHQS